MKWATETELVGRTHRAQVYKQDPGADIEAGWYYVLHGPWFDPERPRWFGPYTGKRVALKMARAALREAR